MTERPTANERDTFRSALVALVAERGYSETSLEAVLDEAGLGHPAFERHYPDLEACFTDVWEGYKEEFLRVTGEAFASVEGWRDGMRAAAWAFCRFLQEDPDRARFFLVDFHFAGEAVRASRDLVMARYAELIHQGNESRSGPHVPVAQAEAVIGAIWDGAVTHIRNDRLDIFPELIPQAMYLTVYPYLGLEAAQEELRRGPKDIARYRQGEI
jgi:AcrR family transcriptional regulator